MILSIPKLEPGSDTIAAALAYAAAGWYVLPVDPRDKKNPGSRVGKGWPSKSSRDPEQLVAWFAGTDDLIAVHVGRSGAVVFDVDVAADLPDALRPMLNDPSVPFQSTRTAEPGRGHYPYLVPAGRSLGNGKGKLTGGWGEVRGRNGVIIVEPSEHENAAAGARYEWQRTGPLPMLPDAVAALLDDALSTEDAATDAEVDAFLAGHTEGARPSLLAGKVRGYLKKLADGESRHDTACPFTAGAMREARLGYYPAAEAAQRLQAAFVRAATSDKPGDPTAKKRSEAGAAHEWAGILAWAVGQAKAATDDELRAVRTRINKEMPDAAGFMDGVSLASLLEVLRRYQDLDDPGHILVTLAVGATRNLDDEAAWLLIVAVPSSGKTEATRLLDGVADARLNEVTAPGLLCWGKGKPPQPTGVLADLGPRGLLTFGDLSSLLATSDRGGRDQVFGLLRRVYDGYASRDIAPPPGAAGKLIWQGRATVVAAVTGVIDSYTAHADALGPRWVYYRLDERSTAEKRAAALKARQAGMEQHRKQAATIAADLVRQAQAKAGDLKVPDEMAWDVEDAALVCCWGRAAVPRHGYGRREIDGQAMVEEPPRLIRQLGVVARGLLALGVDEDTATALVRRVALDSMPATRRAVLEVLSNGEMHLTTAKVAAAAKLDRGVARRTLEELEVIGVVEGHREGAEPEEQEPDRRACAWSLHGDDGALVADVIVAARKSRRRCSEMWGPPTQPPNERDEDTTPPHISEHPAEPLPAAS